MLESIVHSVYSLLEPAYPSMPSAETRNKHPKSVMKRRLNIGRQRYSGFSVIELLIVLGIIAVMSAISLPYIVNYKKLHKSEAQALQVIDLLRETGRLAINRRRTIRLEIDLTDNAVLIIDENNAAPDTRIKSIPLEKVGDLRMDILPAGITKPNPPNFADVAYSIDTVGHRVGTTTVVGHMVWVARFRSDGSVVNNANIPLSANIYVWPPISPGSVTPRNKGEVRVITVFGGTGAIRFWKHNGTSFVANQ